MGECAVCREVTLDGEGQGPPSIPETYQNSTGSVLLASGVERPAGTLAIDSGQAIRFTTEMTRDQGG